MPNVIVRPDLPLEPYAIKFHVKVNRTSSWDAVVRECRRVGRKAVEFGASQGFELMESYGFKILGGPYPVIKPKPLPKPKPRGRLQTGPHDRNLDMVDRSFLVDIVGVDVADEVEYVVGGLFLHRQIQTEMLDTDIAALNAKRRKNGHG